MKLYRGRRSVGPVCIRDKKAREMGRRRSETKTAKRSSYIVLAFLVMWLPLPVTVGVGSYYIQSSESGIYVQTDSLISNFHYPHFNSGCCIATVAS